MVIEPTAMDKPKAQVYIRFLHLRNSAAGEKSRKAKSIFDFSSVFSAGEFLSFLFSPVFRNSRGEFSSLRRLRNSTPEEKKAEKREKANSIFDFSSVFSSCGRLSEKRRNRM